MSFAIMFPGQGSQTVGMLQDLATAYPVVKETFIEAAQVLDVDLWALVQHGPQTELNRTQRTQPAMLAAGVAVWRVWREVGGPVPTVMAGHSLGEYTALVCAGALDYQEAVALVADRGRYMQEATAEGVGAVGAIIGLHDDQVQEICAEAAQGEVVTRVNFNAPGQVVIAGHTAAVQRALEQASRAGAKRAVLLPLSVPVHSKLMDGAADRLRERLAKVTFQQPAILIISNVDVVPHGTPEAIRDSLARQVNSPVRWAESMAYIAETGIELFIELGSGKVLTDIGRHIDFDLRKRLNRRIYCEAVQDTSGLQRALDKVFTLSETATKAI